MKQIKRLMVVGVFLGASILQFVAPPQASAAWVYPRSFDQYTLDLKCNQISYSVGAAGNRGAQNFGGTVSDWYCVITPSWKYWISPGDACRYRYGKDYRFVTTNFYYKYGGYCAVWR